MWSNRKRIVALPLAAAVSVVVALAGCSDSRAVQPEARTAVSVPAKSTPSGAATHGSAQDLSDFAPSVSLDTAVSTLKPKITLPPPTLVGEVDKAILDTTAADEQGNPGLIVRYDSGIELQIRHGELDLARRASEPAAPLANGDTHPWRLQVDSGRQLLVTQGGSQSSARGDTNSIPFQVIWNMDGYTYKVVARSASVTMGDLMKTVNSIR